MRVVIVGAGAIGTWFGVRLASAGFDVAVLARGATLAAIRRSGLRLVAGGTSTSVKVNASDQPAQLGNADLVVLSVKGHALAGLAPAMSDLLHPHTTVLSAMNGIPWWFFYGSRDPMWKPPIAAVDPDGRISEAVPPASVLGCVVHATCATSELGCTVHRNGNTLVVGEPGGAHSGRLNATAAALRTAGFEVTTSRHIQQDVWYKLWGNMTINPISALTGATGDKILDDPLINAFVLRVMREAADIGVRIGCPIAESGEDRSAMTRRLGAFKTSMLQDVEARRPLELDALLAAPREIGRRLGVATPNMDALHGLTRLFAAEKGLNAATSTS